ncbi:MAG: phage-shock protein [Desulfobacteraceae bacterium]|jgi:phage shock protein B
MHNVLIVAIVFGSLVIALAIIPVTILFAIRIIKGRVSGSNQGLADEEARMIQEIYHCLEKMESRVEALETLLLEKERKEK